MIKGPHEALLRGPLVGKRPAGGRSLGGAPVRLADGVTLTSGPGMWGIHCGPLFDSPLSSLRQDFHAGVAGIRSARRPVHREVAPAGRDFARKQALLCIGLSRAGPGFPRSESQDRPQPCSILRARSFPVEEEWPHPLAISHRLGSRSRHRSLVPSSHGGLGITLFRSAIPGHCKCRPAPEPTARLLRAEPRVKGGGG